MNLFRNSQNTIISSLAKEDYSPTFGFALPIPHRTVADPGFPVGGEGAGAGAPTPEAVTFRKICMSKRKNLPSVHRLRYPPELVYLGTQIPGRAASNLYIIYSPYDQEFVYLSIEITDFTSITSTHNQKY